MKFKAHFVTSASKPSEFPPPDHPEIAIVGRSNVGKSSLINALVGQDGLARTSRTPGRTRLVNWFQIDAAHPFHFVDLPGYGFAQVSLAMKESWRPLIESYLSERKTLAGVMLLIDIRRGVGDEELDFVPWLEERGVPMVLALTKADKLPKNKRALEVEKIKRELGLRKAPIATSTLAKDTGNIDALWRAVLALMTP
jgi:GTP-binding protein